MTAEPPKTRVQELIEIRRRAKKDRDKRQIRLISDSTLQHDEIARKLRTMGDVTSVQNFLKCGIEDIYRSCTKCGRHTSFKYQCCRKWCPRCARKLAAAKAEKIKIWAAHIKQPKHLVLTMKNFPELTGDCIREFQRNLVRLRRQKIFAEVRGGCASIEITNEGAGWHLHAHMLLDVPFLDIAKVAILWASLVKQQFAIVHISDLRATDYVREVSKYVVKGNELARWPAKDLIEFLTAIHGRRFFFQFGSLRDAREAIALEIEKNRPEKQSCECGCQEFDYETEAMSVMREIEQSHGVFRKRKKRF